MGRRAHICMAWKMPPPRQRLANLHLLVNRMGAAGLHPNAHPKHRKILLSLRKF